MQDWLTLDRRPTLVFGAGGLGGAGALSLAAQGARVALVDVSQDKLDAVVRAAKEAGHEIKPLAAGNMEVNLFYLNQANKMERRALNGSLESIERQVSELAKNGQMPANIHDLVAPALERLRTKQK